jgi:hypothetical protein
MNPEIPGKQVKGQSLKKKKKRGRKRLTTKKPHAQEPMGGQGKGKQTVR